MQGAGVRILTERVAVMDWSGITRRLRGIGGRLLEF